MKVKDLIKKLQNVDQELSVILYNEEGLVNQENHIIQAMELDSISESDAEMFRDDENNKPRLKFGKSEMSVRLLLMEVLSDV